MKVRMIPVARREMARAARRYGRERPGHDERFLDAEMVGITAIKDWPHAHPTIVPAPYRKVILSGFPYMLIYRLADEEATIAAVAHMKRRPSYWKRRAIES